MSSTFWRATHALLFVLAACSCGSALSVVMTDRGLVQGVQQGDLTVYKGIPFAAPPIGALRWRVPQPVLPWSGVKVMDHFAPRCMQVGMYPETAPAEPMSEDCLYLNLWVPAHAANAKVPVMAWIYGGGLDNGSGSTPLYEGDVLARQDVIVVTFNYRLGVFGFLAHQQLAEESPLKATGNYGLLDQIAALKWINRNIASFGGDPSRVTVFGQSSGSISISALSVSPLANGLFRYAIGESGALLEPMGLDPDLTTAGAQEKGAAFAKRSGAASIAALRGMPSTTLLKEPFTPAIIVDGAVIEEPPAEAFRQGRITPTAFLIGANSDEGTVFLTGKRLTPENVDTVLSRDFPSWLVKMAAPSPGRTRAAAYDAAKRFEGDVRFHWDMWAWARLATRAGVPLYLYRFDHPMPCTPEEGCVEATQHGDEMPYVFGHDVRASWSPQDRALSHLMVRCWTHFAKTGSPAGCGLPDWPSYGTSASMMMLGSDPRLAQMQPGFTLQRLDVVYGSANLVAAHPIIALAIALLIFLAMLWMLLRFVHWSVARVRARAHQIQSESV